jgi:hypothetical protein
LGYSASIISDPLENFSVFSELAHDPIRDKAQYRTQHTCDDSSVRKFNANWSLVMRFDLLDEFASVYAPFDRAGPLRHSQEQGEDVAAVPDELRPPRFAVRRPPVVLVLGLFALATVVTSSLLAYA